MTKDIFAGQPVTKYRNELQQVQTVADLKIPLSVWRGTVTVRALTVCLWSWHRLLKDTLTHNVVPQQKQNVLLYSKIKKALTDCYIHHDLWKSLIINPFYIWLRSFQSPLQVRMLKKWKLCHHTLSTLFWAECLSLEPDCLLLTAWEFKIKIPYVW